jgi:hypothetical protein
MADKPDVRIRRLEGGDTVEIAKTDDYFDVVFGKPGTLCHVSVRVRDGWLEIGVDDQLEVRPVSPNLIRLRPVHGLSVPGEQ